MFNKTKKEEPKKLINSIEDLEKVIDLMKSKRVDCIKVDGVEIYVSKHEYPDLPASTGPKKTQEELDEEALYWSAGQ